MSEMETILTTLRIISQKKGEGALNLLHLLLESRDPLDTGFVPVEILEDVFFKAGFFIKEHWFSKLVRTYKAESGQVAWKLFFADLAGNFNDKRRSYAKQAFKKIAGPNATISFGAILEAYVPEKHPQVLAKRKMPNEVTKMLEEAFQGAPEEISEEIFLTYFHRISSSMPYNDEYFVVYVENCFAVLGAPDVGEFTDFLEGIISTLMDKVNQKSRDAEGSRTLRRAFAFFDTANSGTVDFYGFMKTVERFGVMLNMDDSQALFDHFCTGEQKTIDYNSFVNEIYN